MERARLTEYDLFVSHAAQDRAWVQGYLLPALGLPAERIMTPEKFQPGMPIPQAFADAVLHSRYTLLIISTAYVADEWIKFGADLALYLTVDEQRHRLIPLQLANFNVPPQIKYLVSLDFTDQARWEHEVKRLLDLLARPEPEVEEIQCPYPGMVPYAEENAAYFYGREGEIRQLLQLVRHPQFLFVIGPSGSGKSSLVFAGLLPELTTGKHFPKDFWRVRVMRPGAEPTKTLVDLLADDLTQLAPAIGGALTMSASIQRLLLVIDQFEELFALTDRVEQTRFIAALRSHPSLGDAAVVLTMRADFYPALMSSELWPVSSSQRLEIAPLRGAALRNAIRQPAADVGVYLEPALLERLWVDAADEPGGLPLIQETMQVLWGERQRRLLTLSAYEQMGRDGRSGLAVAVATKADATFDALAAAQQAIAKRIFVCLVQFGDNCPDTRRQQPITELRSDNDDPHDFSATLQRLTESRLITVSGDDDVNEPVVDISHEALIAGWPRLQRWLDEDRASLLLHRRLEQDADEWLRHDRETSFLYGGWRLTEALRFAARHPDEPSKDLKVFLAASATYQTELESFRATSEAREAALERSRYFSQAVGGAVGAALGYGVAFAFVFLSNTTGNTPNIVDLIFEFLFRLPFGALVGFCIGGALWMFRKTEKQKIVATGLIGALVSALASVLFVLPFQNINVSLFDYLIAGAILGAGLGLGAGLTSTGVRRLATTTLGGLVGAVLTMPTGVLSDHLLVVMLAGLALGGLTALGLQATAVETTKPLPI